MSLCPTDVRRILSIDCLLHASSQFHKPNDVEKALTRFTLMTSYLSAHFIPRAKKYDGVLMKFKEKLIPFCTKKKRHIFTSVLLTF